jgi:hypothetical protein
MNQLIKQLDKKYGSQNVVWGLIIIFILLALVCFALLSTHPMHQGSSYGRGMSQNSYGPSSDAVFIGSKGVPMMSPTAVSSPSEYGRMMMDSAVIAPYPPTFMVGGASSEIVPFGQKEIRNASLDLIVLSADAALVRIKSIAKGAGGFVENANIYEVADDIKSGSVTVRVPKDRFDITTGAIKALAEKVQSENVNTQDISASYVDLAAQVVNLRVEEEQYQQILKKATKIEEILMVTQRLSDVRYRIDSAQNQLNGLGRQVDMSSIYVSLTSQAEVEVFGLVWKPLTVIKLACKSLLQDLIVILNTLIFFVIRLPALLIRLGLFVALLVVIWKAALWLKTRLHKI